MFRGYFDSSGNEDPYRTLGGLAGTDEVWSEFKQKWNEILTNRPIPAAYLHMREAAHTTKEFDRKKGWTDRLVHQLLFDLLVYLQNLDGDKIGSFSCTVDAKAHAELIVGGVEVESIERICTHECCEVSWMWHFDKYKNLVSGSEFFFDLDEPYEGSFKAQWQEHRETNDPFWQLVQSVSSVNMRDNPALQGADLIAWAVNRSLNPNAKDYCHLDEVIRGVVYNRRIFWDKEMLRAKYARIIP